MNRISAALRQAPSIIGLAFGMVAVTPSEAWAYVDPGTGSYLFQLAAAGLLAGMYTMRRYWTVFTGALRGRSAGTRGSLAAKRANDME
jgi:hypothetical protein